MPIERVYFWGVHGVLVFYALAAVSLIMFLAGLYLRVSVWLRARGRDRLGFSARGALRVALDGLLGRRIFKGDLVAGVMHSLIMWGFAGLFAGTVMSTIDHWFVKYLVGETYRVFSLCLEIFGIMLIAGILVAIFRRYVLRIDRLDNQPQDLLILVWLAVAALTGFTVEAFRLAVSAPSWESFSFGGLALSRLISSPAAAQAAYPWVWWVHAAICLGLVAYFPFSKLFHSLAAPVNIYAAPLATGLFLVGDGSLMADTADATDAPPEPGPHFAFRESIGLSACTRCGRCQQVCPSTSAGEPFSPREFIAQANAYTRGAGSVSAEQSWFCTTCRACLEVCPIYIAAFQPVRRVRMAEIEEGSGIPPLLTKALETLYTFGNPWEPSKRKRSEWAAGLDVPDLTAGTAGAEAPLCYWVGCTTSIDTRAQKLARALVGILASTGVSFGTLGQKEGCCGDIAQRVGEEGLFQEQQDKTAALLEKHGITDLVTSSPHCFNLFKNEYPEGGRPGPDGKKRPFRVRHYTQLLEELLDKGLLRPLIPVKATVTFHDPCYLGRYNQVYEAPRRLLRAIPGIRLVEMVHHGPNSLCCGGGGGRMWQELAGELKLAEVRAREATDAGAEIIVTACPYCLIMLEDAVKTADLEGRLTVMDLNEVLSRSLGLDDEGG